MSKSTILNLLASSLLILFIGLSSGYAIGYFEAQKSQFPQIKRVEELNPYVSTVKLLKYENGVLYGKVEGQLTRLAHSPNHIRDLEVGEAFEIPVKEINLGAYYNAQTLPEDISYIASKSGKYYYHVLDPRAFKITPKNRRFFHSENEALNEGYLAPK